MKKLCRSLLVVVLTVSFAAPMHAETHRIAVEYVAAFLRLDSRSVSLSLPTVLSRIDRPALQLLAAQRQGSSLRLRLGCVNRGCLPFYAKVDFGSSDAANRFFVPGATSTSHSSKVVAATVHSGTKAKLEIHTSGVRVQLFVTCLQSGSVGDVVRARDEVTKKIYAARVIDKEHLRAQL